MPLEQMLRSGIPAVPIVRWGDEILHRPSRPVREFGPELWNLLCTLFATNEAAGGAGLAAPQVGVDEAVFVFDCLDAFGRRHQGLVCNPVVEVHHDPQMAVDHEGCLSYPGAFHPLARPDYAVCRGQDQFGEPITVRGTGTLARCLQHETEHVRGIVFRDHLDDAGRRALRTMHTRAGDEFPPDWPS